MKLKLYSFVFAVAVAVSAQQLNAQSFTPTDMATLNGVAENSITLSPSADLTGSFPYEAANGSNPDANMITVVGLVNSTGQWVGGAPQVIYNAVPSQSGSTGTANWSNLVVPSSAGTYQLYFQTFMNANASSDVSAFESSPPTSSGLLSGIVATVIVQASGPPTFTPTAMATLNGTQENSINLTPSADLSGSFPYLAADGGSAGQNMITVVGLVNGSGQWVGGAPQVIYNSVPSGSGSSGTADWSNLAVPSSAGTYQLWFESFLTTSTSSSVNSFEASPPTASGDLAGIVATVVVGGPPTFTPTAMATLNGTQENSVTLTPGADLSGSFPYLAADGGSAGQNMITIVGLLNNAGQCVGGSPQIVYNGVPSQGGSSGTANWSNLVMPSSAGTYQLWFQSFLTTDTSGSINSFEESPPTASGDLAGIVATAVVEQSSPTPVIVGAQGINWWSGNTPSTPSLSLSSGNQLYVYGATTGGGSSMSAFANGQTVQLQNGAGNVSAELAVTANSNNSYTTGTAYDAFGGFGVSGFNFAQGFYGVNPGPGPNLQASVQFTLSAPALVVVMGMGSSQATMTLSGLNDPTIDVSEVDGVYEPVLGIEHEYLGAGTYTVQVTTGDGTSYIQTPSHEVDLIGVLIFSTSPNVATSSYPQIPLPGFQPPSVPIVTTGSASGVTANSATLNGSVNPNGLATTYYFQLGTSTAYGTTITPSQNSLGSATTAQNVYAQNVSGLNPNTTYHFRLVADNSTGPAYGVDQTFTTLSGGIPAPVISSTYSTLILAPTSQPADGSSQITATATLRDVNDSPVTNRTIQFSAAGQAAVKIANSTTTTDSNGKATTTITATTPGTSTICLIDPVNVNLITSATATFTQQGFVLPNSVLSNAIVTLYQNTASTLDGGLLSISATATNAGAYGDIFRANMNQDDVQGALGPLFDLLPIVPAVSDTAEFASLLEQPGVIETGSGLITDTPQLSYLFDEGLLQGQFASQVLPSVFNQFLSMANDQVVEGLDEAGITYALDNLGGQANGLSSSGQNIAIACTNLQQAIQQPEQSLLTQGIPASIDQLSWANDLTARSGVSPAFQEVLIQDDQFLGQLYTVKQQANQNAFDFMLAKFAIQTAATVFLDGPGALVAGSVFAVTDGITAQRTLTGDQSGYNSSLSLLSGCANYADQTYLNTASAYNEISQTHSSNPVNGQIGSMTDWENGYAALGLFGLQSVFSATNAYSLLEVENTSSQAATFEIYVLSSYSSAPYGISVANLSQVSTTVTNIPGETDVQIPIVYYDGQNGGTPDPNFPMVVYVLGNNQSGTFYIGGFSHNWNPTMMTNGTVWQPLVVGKQLQNPSVKPLDDGGSSSSNSVTEIENPVSCYVVQNPTNQTYQAKIFVVNPFGQTCSAIVTQAMPSGITVLTTDGMSANSSIVWTNNLNPTNVAEDNFTFDLSVAPGDQTNLPPPTVTFVDESNNQSSPFNSTVPGFNGVFPVQVNGSVPVGVLGVDSAMQVTVTNLTGTNQTGCLTISLTDSTGNAITNFTQMFSLDGSDGTNLNFILPGSLPAGSYSFTGSLSINGGTGQVLAGTYVVPAPPIILAPASASALTTDGFNMALQGPAGNYLIEASSNLSSSTNWQPILYYSATNSSFYYYFTDPNATNYSQQFYRVLMQ